MYIYIIYTYVLFSWIFLCIFPLYRGFWPWIPGCPVAQEFSRPCGVGVAQQGLGLRELGEETLPDGRTPQLRWWKDQVQIYSIEKNINTFI